MDIRVMVASEVRLYRDALQSVLRGVAGIALVGVASSAEEVVKQACMLAPSVAVVDMAMIESFTVATPIARAPQVGGVVVLGIPEVPAEVIACLPSGILGFVSRDGTVAVLLDAIRAAGRANPPQKVLERRQHGWAHHARDGNSAGSCRRACLTRLSPATSASSCRR